MPMRLALAMESGSHHLFGEAVNLKGVHLTASQSGGTANLSYDAVGNNTIATLYSADLGTGNAASVFIPLENIKIPVGTALFNSGDTEFVLYYEPVS